MNYILISPHFPENFKPFAKELKKKGINVLGIGDEVYDNLGKFKVVEKIIVFLFIV